MQKYKKYTIKLVSCHFPYLLLISEIENSTDKIELHKLLNHHNIY